MASGYIDAPLFTNFRSSGKIIFTLRSHHSPVCALSLLGNEYLASGARDGKIVITNVVSGEALHFLQADTKAVSALAVTHLQRYDVNVIRDLTTVHLVSMM